MFGAVPLGHGLEVKAVGTVALPRRLAEFGEVPALPAGPCLVSPESPFDATSTIAAASVSSENADIAVGERSRRHHKGRTVGKGRLTRGFNLRSGADGQARRARCMVAGQGSKTREVRE